MNPELHQCGETRIHQPHTWVEGHPLQVHHCPGLEGTEAQHG